MWHTTLRNESPEERRERLRRIRAELASGTYVVEKEKLVQRLLELLQATR